MSGGLDIVTEVASALAIFLVGSLIYSGVYYLLDSLGVLPKKFFWLGFLFFAIVLLDNLTAVGWAIADHRGGVFHFNWWAAIQWWPFSEITNTVPAGNATASSALPVLLSGFWTQSMGAIVVLYLWWVAQGLLLAWLARWCYRWLNLKLA